MKNIADYVASFPYPFEEKPFTDVDSLVLSMLAYLHYEGLHLEAPAKPKTLEQLAREECSSLAPAKENLAPTLQLLYSAGHNPRFAGISLQDYVSILDEPQEMQFAAMTFVISDTLAYIAYRGTDATLVGWRENANMTVLPSIPSQRAGVVYLDGQARKREGSLITGGHSKGGNIAVYAAACCAPSTQDRILTVFNHDGPGFQRAFLAQEGYRGIVSRMRKTMPHQSTVGLLLNHREPSFIVQSSEEGVNQHDGFSWLVQDGAFIPCEGLSRRSWLIANSINLRVNTISGDQLRPMIAALFEIIRLSEATSFEALAEALTHRSPEVEAVIANLPPSSRGKFVTIARIMSVVFQP